MNNHVIYSWSNGVDIIFMEKEAFKTKNTV